MASKQQQIAQWMIEALKLHQTDRFAEAEQIYRRVLERERRHPDATHYLGLLLSQTDRVAEAVPLMQRAIMLNPAIAHYHTNLAEALRRAGDIPGAILAARRATELQPNSAECAFQLGVMLQQARLWDQAIRSYTRATAINPHHHKAMNNLANAFVRMGRIDEALRVYEEAHRTSPESPELLANWGRTLLINSRFDEAMQRTAQAQALDPENPVMLATLGRCHASCFDIEEGVRCLEKSIQLRPSEELTRSALLFVMLHCPGLDPAELLEAHRAWGRNHAPPPAIDAQSLPNNRDADRPLRVGYVSGDFRQHPVSYFVEPILANHTGAVQVFCYNTAPPAEADATTSRIKSLGHEWREISSSDDATVAQSMRKHDKLDILVDLAGHTQNNRLTLFARRIAPIQVTYLGYQATTGIESVDYRLTDALVDPPGMTESLHTERLARLKVFACYRPPDGAPAVGPLPLLRNGYVTFGAFTKTEKISAPTMDLWARVLQAVPASRLAVFAAALDSPSVAQKFLSLMGERGISSDRIDRIGGQSLAAYLASHDRVDLALDSLPFNAHTTTMHALWMGIPTVTIAGSSYPSRMGLAVMTHLGLCEYVAGTPDDFVRTAAERASDTAALAELRGDLRQRIAKSALTEAHGFCDDLETAYRTLWHRWCAGGKM